MKTLVALLMISGLVAATGASAETSQRGEFFLSADADKSATLDRKEFESFINLLAESGHKNAKRVRFFRLYSIAWARIDRNSDGQATRAELSNAQSAHKPEKKRRVARAVY